MSEDEFDAINFLLTLLDGALELQDDEALMASSKPIPTPPPDLASRILSALAEDELLEILSLIDLRCEAALVSDNEVIPGRIPEPPANLMSIVRQAVLLDITEANLTPASISESLSKSPAAEPPTRAGYMWSGEIAEGSHTKTDRFVDDTILETSRTAAMWAYVHGIDTQTMAELICAAYATVLAPSGAISESSSERQFMLRRELVRSFLQECERKRKRSSPRDDARSSEKRAREMDGLEPQSRDLLEEICNLAPIERDIVLLESDSFTAEEISSLLRIELHEVVMRRNRAHTRLSKRFRSSIEERSLL